MMNILGAGNRSKIVDLIGILLVLMIGIRGQIFVYHLTTALSPQIPLLSAKHLPGSQLVARLQMPQDWRQDNREYFLRMKIAKSKDYIKDVTVWQYTTWHADPTKPADEWNKRKREFNSEPIPLSSFAIDKPESALYCPNQTNYPSINFYEQNCSYLAFRGHWYTEVVLYSRGEEYLSYTEIQKIVNEVDQLLLAAPDEP